VAMENRVRIIKDMENQKPKRQTNFIVTSEFIGNKKLSELVERLIKSEISKIERAQ